MGLFFCVFLNKTLSVEYINCIYVNLSKIRLTTFLCANIEDKF